MKNEVRSTELGAALESAVLGKTADLFRQLENGSGLPGPRPNINFAIAFSHDCARLGPKVDDLANKMATIPAGSERGAAPKEFLVMCGVLAVCARAMVAKENAVRTKAFALLEERADDPRFRVREVVPLGLAMMGSKMKDELAEWVVPWMDRYFHAAAVILAMSQPSWLETFALDAYYQPINLLQDAFTLAHNAPRSAERYPGHKALVEALGTAPRAIAKRFPQQMFDRFAIWAEHVKIPELREVILKNIEVPEFKKAWREQIKNIRDLIEKGKAPPRDPTIIRHGTRGRGKKRSRR